MALIRRATHTDAQALANVHRLSRAAAMPWLPVVHSLEEDLAFFRNEVLASQTTFVAEVSSCVVGFIAFTDDWLNHLYIAREEWRKGLGTQLLSKAKTHSASLQLWTFQDNKGARAFYQQHGFEEIELTDGATNEEKTPDVRMVWQQAPTSKSLHSTA